MSSPYTSQADNILIGMHDYLSGFTVYHSDLMYNYYKEKVFTISYDQILTKLSGLYGINKVYFDQTKLNSALTVLHRKYREFEVYYTEQRDLETDLSRVTPGELEKIPLTLEKYTASFLRHLIDLKIGFNLFLIAETQRNFFKTHKAYDTSQLNAKPTQVNPAQPTQATPMTSVNEQAELTMNITNMDGNVTPNMPRMNPEEFLVHLNAIKDLCNNYFDTHLPSGTKYQLEMKLVFPQS